MHDVAVKRRLAALVIAALPTITGAALTAAVLAADAHAENIRGTFREDNLRTNDGDTMDGARAGLNVDGGFGENEVAGNDGQDLEIY